MKNELEQLLVSQEAYLIDGQLNKNKLSELARKYDADLLRLLQSNEQVASHFFSKIDNDILVFKQSVFLQFLNNKEFLPDSFTAYKTKIGLATGDKYLSENQDVVLNFPYKDCVLEGGQTKDDAKRQEIFFNETLAPTEINRLLDDKVLTNFKRYDKDGEHEVEELLDTDNLLIKGNNLIALHSLKKRFAGKIKLIYIDPPYNTGNDSFGYNDSFNHSTWLTFMKNRLEVARELLSDEGSIWISIDDDEGHYTKVLCDEIFGRENFINTVIWEKKYTVSNDAKYFSDNHDFILVYAKNKENWHINSLPRTIEMNKAYKNPDNHEKGVWKSTPLHAKSGSAKGEKFSYTFRNGVTWTPPSGTYPRFSKETLERLDMNNEIWFGKDGNAVPSRKTFLKELKTKGVTPKTLWRFDEVGHNHGAREEIKGLFNLNVFDTPKPESLLQRIIHLATGESDIVLDYHLGSGTTAAVAHKMKRQYIGIEQMDYIETVSVKRLKKVIAGEQGGISKDVNWTGGGSFVYIELKNDVQDYKNAIIEATTTDELLKLFELAKTSSFLSYRINPKKLKVEEFKTLSLAEQKELLAELVDNNNLYVNFSDIDDTDYAVSDSDKQLNHQFYGEE